MSMEPQHKSRGEEDSVNTKLKEQLETGRLKEWKDPQKTMKDKGIKEKHVINNIKGSQQIKENDGLVLSIGQKLVIKDFDDNHFSGVSKTLIGGNPGPRTRNVTSSEVSERERAEAVAGEGSGTKMVIFITGRTQVFR